MIPKTSEIVSESQVISSNQIGALVFQQLRKMRTQLYSQLMTRMFLEQPWRCSDCLL